MAAESWELHPYEGAGPLTFGMTRDQVIELVGQPEVVIHRQPYLVEAIGEIHPEYHDGRLIGLHTAGSTLTWHGITLTERPAGDVARDLAAEGVQCEPDEEDVGLVAPALGIALYAPDDDDYPTRWVQGVLVKSREYDTADQ